MDLKMNFVKALSSAPYDQSGVSFGVQHWKKPISDISNVFFLGKHLFKPLGHFNTVLSWSKNKWKSSFSSYLLYICLLSHQKSSPNTIFPELTDLICPQISSLSAAIHLIYMFVGCLCVGKSSSQGEYVF